MSWLLIQNATQMFPFFEISNRAVRLVVFLLILGFPVALILSWTYQITPEGIKRESDVAPEHSNWRHLSRTEKKVPTGMCFAMIRVSKRCLLTRAETAV